MKKFYTVTDLNTESTNSRSKRYDSLDEAIAEASDRINTNQRLEGVVILEAIRLVRRKRVPIEIEEINL